MEAAVGRATTTNQVMGLPTTLVYKQSANRRKAVPRLARAFKRVKDRLKVDLLNAPPLLFHSKDKTKMVNVQFVLSPENTYQVRAQDVCPQTLEPLDVMVELGNTTHGHSHTYPVLQMLPSLGQGWVRLNYRQDFYRIGDKTQPDSRPCPSLYRNLCLG